MKLGLPSQELIATVRRCNIAESETTVAPKRWPNILNHQFEPSPQLVALPSQDVHSFF
jgi:hypothetical protein